MPAPTIAAVGMVLVVLDLRAAERDLVPDSLGFALAAWAFLRLADREDLFRAAGLAAAAAAVAGLLEYAPGLLSGIWATAAVLGYNLLVSATLALAGVAHARCAVRAGEDSVAGQGRWLARLMAVSWLVLVAGVLLDGVPAAASEALVGLATVANLAGLVWMLVLLALRRTTACLTA